MTGACQQVGNTCFSLMTGGFEIFIDWALGLCD